MAGYLHLANSLSQFRCCSSLLCHPSTCLTAAWASPFLPWLTPIIPHSPIFGPIFNTPADNRNIVVDYRVLVVLDKYSISEFSRACITITPHEIGPVLWSSDVIFSWPFTHPEVIFTEFPPGVSCYCVTISNSIVYAIFIDCAVYFLASVAGLIGNTTFLGIPVHALKSSFIACASIPLLRDEVAVILFSQYNAIW